jgi:hypothetical protein
MAAGERVNVDNFVRAETNRMFAALGAQAGGVNAWHHTRGLVPIAEQTVIRMNRDTLYSTAVIDTRKGAALTLPDGRGRYLSAMVVDQDHYVVDVLHEPGVHELEAHEAFAPYVLVGVRILVDPSDDADLREVHTLQDGLGLTASSAVPFTLPGYDEVSFNETREAVLSLARGISDASRAFGSRESVDPIHHLLGSALGWGGLPASEAVYLNVEPNLPVGTYRLDVPENLPVDGFWSVSVYNRDGFFERNDRDAYLVNSVTAQRNDDGSVTVYFGDFDDGRPNSLPITDGWNYTVRLYRPRPEVVDGTWTFPDPEQA